MLSGIEDNGKVSPCVVNKCHTCFITYLLRIHAIAGYHNSIEIGTIVSAGYTSEKTFF